MIHSFLNPDRHSRNKELVNLRKHKYKQVYNLFVEHIIWESQINDFTMKSMIRSLAISLPIVIFEEDIKVLNSFF